MILFGYVVIYTKAEGVLLSYTSPAKVRLLTSPSGSIDVGLLRPGQITLKGYSQLKAGGDTWFAEDVHTEYLHNPHH